MQGEKLSVLIPTYKRPQALQWNLSSLIKSKVNAFEIVIGDDGGDLETEKVIKSYSHVLPIVHLTKCNNSSLASNLTRIIKAATGDWALLIHDDDFLTGDHSGYPNQFSSDFDFVFFDHWIAHEDNSIDTEATENNSVRYGRNLLLEGAQSDGFQLAINQNVCLDGFYVRLACIRKIPIDSTIGQVADYFWMFKLLTSNIRIGYFSKRLFAYRISNVGLTGKGGRLNEDSIIGFEKLLIETAEQKHQASFRKKISFNTWYAVNACIKRNESSKAIRLLEKIGFRYSHSSKHQFLILFQLLYILKQKTVSFFKKT